MGNTCKGSKQSIQRRFSRIESYSNAWTQYGYFDISHLLNQCSEVKLSVYTSKQFLFQSFWPEISQEISSSPSETRTPALKKLIRKGVSDLHIRDLALEIFLNTKSDYQSLLKTEIPHQFFHVPTFSKHFKVESAVNKLYITDAGVIALCRVMWVLSNYNNSIVYSPQIVNIASLLLVYTSEEETFEVLSKMIKISAKTDKCLEKFFTFTQTEIGNVVEMASLVIRHKRNDLCEFFSSKGLNLGNTLAELVKDFFIGYLPLTFLTRVLPIFLLEGVKSQVKLIVSLMVNYSEKIMDFESGDFFSYLKQIFLHVCYPEQIIKYSFKIRLTKYSFEKIESTYSDTPAALYYRPQITQKFQILTEHLIEVLWSHLPGIYKHYRPGKLFSSQEHGCSMRTLLRKTQSEQKRTPMLLVILTEFKEVIGVFLDCAIQSSKGYIGDSSSFVFTLKPEVEVYRSTGENNLYANINEEMCSFGGGGNGPALIIDEELLLGQSYVCSTFDNKVLGRTYFNVLECEIIALLS